MQAVQYDATLLQMVEHRMIKWKQKETWKHHTTYFLLNWYCTGPDDTKTDVNEKRIEGSGMKMDQAEQLDVLLIQSAKVLNKNEKNEEAEETDTFTTSKRDNRSPSPLDSQSTQTVIIMVGKKNADLSLGKYQIKTQTKGELIVTPQI